MPGSKRKHKETVIGRKDFVKSINMLLQSANRWKDMEDTIGLHVESPLNEAFYTIESTF